MAAARASAGLEPTPLYPPPKAAARRAGVERKVRVGAVPMLAVTVENHGGATRTLKSAAVFMKTR